MIVINKHKSNGKFYDEALKDVKGVTLVSASSKELKLENNNIETCTQVGKLVA